MKWLELHIDTARAGLEPVSELLREQGVRVTVTIHEGANTLTQGDPACLYGLNRFNITEDVTGDKLLQKLIA